MEWTVYVRRPDLRRAAQIDGYDTLELVQRWRGVGTWSLDLDGRLPAAALLTRPGWGIEVCVDDVTVFAGPTREPEHGVDAVRDRLRIVGWDDTVWLRRRLVHPQPATPSPPYNTFEHDVRSGVASTVIRAYVNANLGPGALSARRVFGLTLSGDPAVGGSVTGRGRWQQLLPFLVDLAVAGGDLGFRVRQVGAGLLFDVYQPLDLTARVKLSLDLGSLAAYAYSAGEPDATYIYCGGGGEGTARTIREGQDQAAIAVGWGRIEKFADRRDTTDTTELDQEITSRLADLAGTGQLELTPIDLPGRTYLTDYELGTRVTAVVDGVTLTESVSEARITLTPDRVDVVPAIGSSARPANDTLRIFRAYRALAERVADLERRR